MSIRTEIPGSDVACETLDVRQSLEVGETLTVAGIPITGSSGPAAPPTQSAGGSGVSAIYSGVGFTSVLTMTVDPADFGFTALPFAFAVDWRLFLEISPAVNEGGSDFTVEVNNTFALEQILPGPPPIPTPPNLVASYLYGGFFVVDSVALGLPLAPFTLDIKGESKVPAETNTVRDMRLQASPAVVVP